MNFRKSSYSGGSGGNCVEVGNDWRKASYSGGQGGNCVEVASNGTILVRDTTDRDGATLKIPASAWENFAASLK
jgi:hypothetical protein